MKDLFELVVWDPLCLIKSSDLYEHLFLGNLEERFFPLLRLFFFSDHPQNTRVFKEKLLFLALQTQAVAASLDDLKGISINEGYRVPSNSYGSHI